MNSNINVITISDIEFKRLIESAIEEGVERALSKVMNYSDDKFITAVEAAQLLGCSTNTINRRRQKGQYSKFKKIGHEYLYSTKELTRGNLSK